MVMGNLSSNFNLTLLNLFIGMCRGARGLPRAFKDLGYIDKWIEYKFYNSQNEEVVPELILISEPQAHSLLFEWKSGANTDPDQLRRYSNITQEDLQQRAFIEPRCASSHDVTVIGKSEFIDRILIGIRDGNYDFPVLEVSYNGLSLKENQFECQRLNQVFDTDLEINMHRIPTSFIPFDKDSPHWIIAEKIIQRVLEYMSNREPRIHLDKIAGDTIPTWNILSPNYQSEIRNKIKEIMREASLTEFKEYLRYNRQMVRRFGPTWDIISNPLDLHSDKRHAAWKRLQNLQKKFLEALRTGERSFNQNDLPFPNDANSN